MILEHNDAFASLMGKKLVDWGNDVTMYHLVLEDGRILVFLALGIVELPDHAVH